MAPSSNFQGKSYMLYLVWQPTLVQKRITKKSVRSVVESCCISLQGEKKNCLHPKRTMMSVFPHTSSGKTYACCISKYLK